jgi:hypothetical protein
MRKALGGFGTLLALGLGLGLLHSAPAPVAGGHASKQGAMLQQIVPAQGSAAEGKAPPVAKCVKSSCAEQDLLDAIADSSGHHSDEAKPRDRQSLIDEFKSLENGGNEFAIAIVPDPVHTHLSLFSDRTVDAIQQGAQQAGWIFDRATLPWDSEEHAESTDFRIRLLQKKYQDEQEEWPGLMIFRRADPEDRKLDTLLYVFVVGETPTGGINKKEFRAAIDILKRAARAVDPLRIIGPTFSGSLYSLAQLIKDQPEDGKFNSVVIRSGTVSSWETAQWFERQKGSENGVVVDFASFQQSDRYMLRRFVEFEKHRGYDPDKIAILTEDETAYGNSFQLGAAQENSCPKEQQSKKPAEMPGDALEADESCVLHLFFPRDISQLRSAYQQGLEQKSSASSDSYQIRSTLPLNLQDTGNDDDSVPQYAHSETPLSQESILLGIVAAIRERHIQFVVLQATNPMDTLFLSAFLKKGYSEARVVAMPADLLLSRDADDVSLLHGVMALTTYSLLPDIDEEVAVPHELRGVGRVNHIFPNAYAVGTFNATLSQIRCFDVPPPVVGCIVNQQPGELPTARYAEYGWPSMGGKQDGGKSLAPVVWLTVLGRDGFWPMAILDGSNKVGDIVASPRPIYSDEQTARYYARFSPPWPVFWGMVCGFVLMLAVMFGLLLRRGSILATSSAMTLLAPVKDRHRSVVIVIIGCLLLSAFLLLIWPWVTWAGLGRSQTLGVIVGVVFVIMLYAGCTEELIRRRATRAGWVFIFSGAALVACFAMVSIVGRHTQNPFLYRYIHLTSGVSPLLPFLSLLAAGLWWSWFSLSGLALVDKRRPQLPNDEDLPSAAPPRHPAAVTRSTPLSEKSAKQLVHVARPVAADVRVYLPAVFFLFVTLFAFDRFHPLLSLETRHFEWIYAVTLAAVTFALFCTLSRLLVIWLECRKILAALDRIPLRRAFAELHFTWEPIWRPGGGRWQDLYRLVSRQLETLEHLKREVQEEDGVQAEVLLHSIEATSQEQYDLSRQFAELLAPGSRHPRAQEPALSDYLIENYQRLQESIARTCAAAIAYLQLKWCGEEGLILSEVGSGDDAKKEENDSELSLSTRLTERFVALVYLNFILTVVLRMRTVALTAGGLYFFLLLSVNSYPFEPKVALRSAAILLLIFVVGTVGYVSAQVHRDSILSLVTQTKPGELGIEFWLRMGTFVALPLLSLLVSQFPTLNNALFSWLEPAVGALK